jgi:hypothetical protein
MAAQKRPSDQLPFSRSTCARTNDLVLATLYALKDELRDAREGRPAYFWQMVTHPESRRRLLTAAWKCWDASHSGNRGRCRVSANRLSAGVPGRAGRRGPCRRSGQTCCYGGPFNRIARWWAGSRRTAPR